MTGVVQSAGPAMDGFPELTSVDVTLTFAADAAVPPSETMRAQNVAYAAGCN